MRFKRKRRVNNDTQSFWLECQEGLSCPYDMGKTMRGVGLRGLTEDQGLDMLNVGYYLTSRGDIQKVDEYMNQELQEKSGIES